jgi:hypothetical protein
MASKLRSGLGTKISFFAFQDIITSVTGILVLTTLILSLYMENPAPAGAEEAALKQQLAANIQELARLNFQNELLQTNLLSLPAPPAPEPLQAQIRELELQFAAISNRLAARAGEVFAGFLQASNRTELLLGDTKRHVTRAEQERAALARTNAALVTQVKALSKDLDKKRERLGGGDNPWFVIPDPSPDGREPVLVTVSATNLACERFNQPQARQTFPPAEAARGLAQNLRRWRPDRDYLVFYVRPSGIELFLQCQPLAKTAGFQTGCDPVEETQNLVFAAPALP